MPLLEREPLLEALDAYLIEASGGRGRVVFLGGEAGVGKTQLDSSFGERVAGTVRVLRGACDGAITPRPLVPLADVAMTSAPPMTLIALRDQLAIALGLAIELLAEITRRGDARPGRPNLVDQTAV
jgi:predicted ATPase